MGCYCLFCFCRARCPGLARGMFCAVTGGMEVKVDINLIFKIAAVGILITILGQILKHSGREEHAFLISLAGLILVLTWILPYIYDLFVMIQELFSL